MNQKHKGTLYSTNFDAFLEKKLEIVKDLPEF